MVEEWARISTTGVCPVVCVYQYKKRRGGTYYLVTYVYNNGREWHDFAPGVVLITPRGKKFEGEEAVKKEIIKRKLPEFF